MAVEPASYLGVLGVDHIGIAVAELDRAVTFYVETLGLRELHREQNPAMGVAEVMLGGWDPAAASGAVTAQVQLLAPLNSDSPIARFLDRSGPGLQHLAYRVRNVEDASRQLQKKGLRLLYDSAKRGTRGSRINFVHPKDAGGVLIELVESPASDAPDVTSDTSSQSITQASEPGGSRPHSSTTSTRYHREQA